MELENLYNIYHANIKVDQFPVNENISPIKVGDILVAIYNQREIRGEVSAVFENYFLLKGKGGTIKVTMDDVTEHYPKNRAFENKGATTLRKFTESVQQTPPPIEEKEEKPTQRVQGKTKKVIDDAEKKQIENSPDNQVDLTIENTNIMNKVKAIGRMLYYKDAKYSDVNDLFEKRLLSKDEYWYLLTEKNDEIHVIRNNNKGFEIQPFANALVGHFLKTQNTLIKESYGQIKVAGNNNFSVISNIPQNIHKQLLNSLIALLSGIKK